MLGNNILFTQNKQNGGGLLLLSKISSRYTMLGGVSIWTLKENFGGLSIGLMFTNMVLFYL